MERRQILSGDSVQAIRRGIERQQGNILDLLEREKRLKAELASLDRDVKVGQESIALMEYDLMLNERTTQNPVESTDVGFAGQQVSRMLGEV